MSKFRRAHGKIERRLGCNLWNLVKSPFVIRNSPPGQHGNTQRKRENDYSMQLATKQKLKHYYDMREKQFKNVYISAKNIKCNTSNKMIELLERRLVTVVYRMRWANTIWFAKQLVSHGHILVNGKKVNIPSYSVKNGEQIELSSSMRNHPLIEQSMQRQIQIPNYIHMTDRFQGNIIVAPQAQEVPYSTNIDVQLMVNFYSR